ncbi:carbohydrate kinase family protein [Patescibacteria group bacterium]|nr:carbohydrate kinase family protein [Patescibacteria group bacterium]MBU1029154.1 carbohydrate kinase family protein [Patescibacteria group bacterium]MBU1916029.1 carbohydrate kinase family protein [Patescibacteria group bacterium]
MFDVITIGSATRDVFVKCSALDLQESEVGSHVLEACFPLGAKIDIDELVFETGGGATNVATTLAHLGFKTATICSIGDDFNGREVIETLTTDGIATGYVQQTTTSKTGYSIIIVAGSGERTVLVYRGAAKLTNAAAVPWKKIVTRWFYLTSVGGNLDLLERALTHAENNQIKIAWNPGNSELKLGLSVLEPLIKKVDVLNLNREEAALLTGLAVDDLTGITEKLSNLPKRSLVITDGSKGAYTVEADGSRWQVETFDVPRINVTGAGDAFGSGFIAGLMQKNDVRYGLAVGLWNSAGCIQEVGAKRGLLENFPSEEQISKVIINPWK